MAKRDPKGDVRTVSSERSGTATASADGAGNSEYLSAAVAKAAGPPDRSEGIAALQELLLRNDGWLRASPDGNGKVCYIKWKFTAGPHAGYYVMVVSAPWEWDSSLEVLLRKIREVYFGTRRPTKDSYFDA